MNIAISKSYLGLSVVLTAAVTPAPSLAARERDDAELRCRRALDTAAQRVADILAVALQDVLRDELTARLLERRLPVVRVEMGLVGQTLDARAFLSDGSNPNLDAATDDQIAEAETVVDAFVAAHAAAQE
jgi:hypothetical protein